MIKNILFDLGGVIAMLNTIDVPTNRFKELGLEDAADYLTLYGQKGFILDLEKGNVTEDEFVMILSEKCGKEITYDQAMWAIMGFIREVRQEPLDYILTLKEKYKVCLLSNTNAFIQKWAASNQFSPDGHPLSYYMHELYCSNDLHDYKPSESIYRKVLELGDMKAEETVFVDDSLKNIEGARKVGITGLHAPENWIPLLEDLLARE